MNYIKHYNNLIERAKNRNILDGVYFEKHHIIPKCIGGSNNPDNIVKLLPDEHYVAHQLLVKIYPNEQKLIYAARLMCRDSNNTQRNNKEYKWLKERFILVRTGVPRSDETKKKIRDGNTGKILSEDTKDKIKIARAKQKMSDESNRKRSETAKAKGIRPPLMTGIPRSSETKQKISKSKKGIPSHWKGKSRPLLVCQHCGKEGAGGAMHQWHFDNCKSIRNC